MSQKNVIVIGASSGIGKALAGIFSQRNCRVAILARRTELLSEVAQELSGPFLVRRIDIANQDEAISVLAGLIKEMGQVDIIVIAAGTGFLNPELDWQKEKDTIDVNVSGFTAMAGVAMKHFLQQGKGHLVGISSIAAIKGRLAAPAYGASKAYMSNYLRSLRVRALKNNLPIVVTDIQPGFVDTAMAKGDGVFWSAPAEKAAQQIFQAIEQKRPHAYITKRWRLIAWVFKILPDWVLAKFL